RNPARQHSDVSHKTDVTHKTITPAPRIMAENLQLSLVRRESENCIESRGLARAVSTDQSDDAALVDPQIHAIQHDLRAERLAQATRFDARHSVSFHLSFSVSNGACRRRANPRW